MKKEIEESHFITRQQINNFRFNNRGKIVKGYSRLLLGRGKWKKHQGEAGVFTNAKGIWKDVVHGIFKGLEKKYNPLVIGWTQKKKTLP